MVTILDSTGNRIRTVIYVKVADLEYNLSPKIKHTVLRSECNKMVLESRYTLYVGMRRTRLWRNTF